MSVIISPRRGALRSPLTYFGGKGRIAHHIVALLPPHDAYLEPFAGGLSVLLRKPPAVVETVNDLNGDLCTFYRVLQNPDQFARFQQMVELTPFAREVFSDARTLLDSDEDDPVRRAWAFFISARQAFGGGGRGGHGTGWSYSTRTRTGNDTQGGSWGYSVTDSCGTRISAAVTRYLSGIERLPAVHARLRTVQIERGDWSRVVAAYGVPDCCIYLDPPYVGATRSGHTGYSHEMPLIEEHQALTRMLLDSPALCVLSGYRHEEVHRPLEEAGWDRTDIDVPINVAREKIGVRRTESIWRNPAAVAAWSAAQHQPRLFEEE